MRQREILVDRLRACVGPPSHRGRTVDDVVVLRERRAGALAVHLAGRRDERGNLPTSGEFEHRGRLVDVRLDRPDGFVDDESHADRRREMEAFSEVVRVERRQHFGDPSFTNLQSITGDPRRELEIRERSGGQIIDDDHLRAGFEQVVHEMGTDEPCSTRDEDCAAIDHISLPATARPNTQPREA